MIFGVNSTVKKLQGTPFLNYMLEQTRNHPSWSYVITSDGIVMYECNGYIPTYYEELCRERRSYEKNYTTGEFDDIVEQGCIYTGIPTVRTEHFIQKNNLNGRCQVILYADFGLSDLNAIDTQKLGNALNRIFNSTQKKYVYEDCILQQKRRTHVWGGSDNTDIVGFEYKKSFKWFLYGVILLDSEVKAYNEKLKANANNQAVKQSWV